jgi:hypothetical protein
MGAVICPVTDITTAYTHSIIFFVLISATWEQRDGNQLTLSVYQAQHPLYRRIDNFG